MWRPGSVLVIGVAVLQAINFADCLCGFSCLAPGPAQPADTSPC